MAITILSYPVTEDEAKEAMRNTGISTASVQNYIKAAIEAAENYTGTTISQKYDDELAVTTGYTSASLPPTIRTAILYHVINQHEMTVPAEWLPSFRDLLYDWRTHYVVETTASTT
jgi:hypothetical protein